MESLRFIVFFGLVKKKQAVITKIKKGIFLKLRGNNIEIENKKRPKIQVFKIIFSRVFMFPYLITLIKSFGSKTMLTKGPMKYEKPFVKSPRSKNIKWTAK